MQTFKHKDGVSFKELKTKTINGKRHYITPNGNYPSVTSITSQISAEAISAWRARVGNEEAQRIITKSSTRGTKVHKLCEDYVNNIQVNESNDVFEQIRGKLDKHLKKVWAIEAPLYSDGLRVAGRVDLIGIWEHSKTKEQSLAIIDFKTSAKSKKEEWIQGYFMQESAYAAMFAERMGWDKPLEQIDMNIVTIIGVDGKDEAELYQRRSIDYFPDFIKWRDKYEANASKSSR